MEILKSIFISCLLFATLAAGAQIYNNATETAFAKSYASEKSKDYKAAIKAISAVYDANSYLPNLRMAWLYYADKDYDNAINYYRYAIKLKPSATETYWGLINALTAKQKWQDVEEAYKQILTYDSANATANYQLALIYFYRKNYLLAKPYLTKAYSLSPSDYYISSLLGWTNYYLGNKADAKNIFSQVLLLNPDDKDIKAVFDKL